MTYMKLDNDNLKIKIAKYSKNWIYVDSIKEIDERNLEKLEA